MEKIVILTIIISVSVCNALTEYLTHWGDTNARPDGLTVEKFVLKHPILNASISNNETITFPESNWISPLIEKPINIDGIVVRNIAMVNPKITFLDGGIGATYVTINIIAPPGRYINCDFTFYITHRVETEPQMIKDYIETEFDIDSGANIE